MADDTTTEHHGTETGRIPSIRSVLEAAREAQTWMTDPSRVRPDIKNKLDEWAAGRRLREPGNFLVAVLTNDLEKAVLLADSYNLMTLPAIVAYVIHTLPRDSHGSLERFEDWLGTHQQ